MVIFTSHRLEILTREISSAATLPDLSVSPLLLIRAPRPDANCDELGGRKSGTNPQHEVKWCGYPQAWAAWPCNWVWWRHGCSAIGVAWPQWQAHAAGSASVTTYNAPQALQLVGSWFAGGTSGSKTPSLDINSNASADCC